MFDFNQMQKTAGQKKKKIPLVNSNRRLDGFLGYDVRGTLMNTNIKDYVLIEDVMGEGGFGKVYKCMLKVKLTAPNGEIIPIGTKIAMKEQKVQFDDDKNYNPHDSQPTEDFSQLVMEIQALRKTMSDACPNVVKIFDVLYDSKKETLYYLMELLEGFELSDYVFDNPSFQALHNAIKDEAGGYNEIISEDELITVYIKPIIQAIRCLHKNGIAHRDLKMENIMRSNDGRITIIDLGLACVENCDSYEETESKMGTSISMAPEVFSNRVRDWFAADTWSVGCIVYEMVTGTILPIQEVLSGLEKKKKEQVILAQNLVYQGQADLTGFPDEYPRLKRLLGGWLTYDPEKRTNL